MLTLFASAILTFALLFLICIPFYAGQKEKSVAFHVILIIITPLLLYITSFIYCLILTALFRIKINDAVNIYEWGQNISFLLSLVLMLSGFTYKHETKSGKKDKRYKDNPQDNPTGSLLLIALYISMSIYAFINNSYLKFTMDKSLKYVFNLFS